MAEHMLRRKTPNGTLAAGYDGRPVEWAARPPPNKHFLMPAPHGSGNLILEPYSGPAKAGSPNVVDSSWTFNVEQPEKASYDRYKATCQNVEDFTPGIGIPHQVESEPKTFANPGLDSVLYQGSPSRQLSHYSGGQQMPIVMQPMWPPCVGITSLNSSGPYGPYWPNGAFVPYRPAPIRDPRFHSGPARPALDGGWQEFQSSPEYSSTNLYRPANCSEADPSSCNTHWMPAAHGHSFPDDCSSMSSAAQVYQATVSPTDRTMKINSSTPFGSKSPAYNDEQCSISNMSGASSLLEFSQSAPYGFSHPSQYGFEANNIEFKEKVLIWAHRVYLGLSCQKQLSRRTGPNVHYQNHRYPSETISPQMSRQELSKISTTQNPIRIAGEQPQSHHSFKGCGLKMASHENRDGKTSMSSKPSVGDPGLVRAKLPFVGGMHYPSTFEPSISQSTYAGFGSRPLAVPGTQACPESSSATAAVTAIEMLSRLCQESGWQWTDGMLLGGCLAYALGDYSKALKWYSKVLLCDPNNVEANSNLAAALSSLARRQEAENYWLRAVKLRPSYFEAVEHLVGMYCEDHRGEEAVQLIELVERSLQPEQAHARTRHDLEPSHTKSSSPDLPGDRPHECMNLHSACNESQLHGPQLNPVQRFGSSGYSIPSSDNGRLLSLIHGKGNMLYALGDNVGAAKAFEKVILIGSAQRHLGIRSLISLILAVFSEQIDFNRRITSDEDNNAVDQPILLMPEIALETSKLVFPPYGNLPGLDDVPTNMAQRAGVSIVSNSLLSLAKIYQDGMSSSGATASGPRATSGVQEILALYYLSLSLQPSPSTANNVGILLASVQQPGVPRWDVQSRETQAPPTVPGIVPGSGIALALAYYNYGLNLDPRHAHLYTNLGSLFKDIGQLSAAIKMYEKAVQCDGSFDIALANLANAVKDQGRIRDAIDYYRRAVSANPDFAEAVCGLANALNSVCNWRGRGGVRKLSASMDRWHVDDEGMLYDGLATARSRPGWVERVVHIVDKQLRDGESWGKGILQNVGLDYLLRQLCHSYSRLPKNNQSLISLSRAMADWISKPWEGAKVVRLIERATKRLGWQVYCSKYLCQRPNYTVDTTRPQLPAALAVPTAPTVLPFHTFTCPLSAKQIRKISQRNGLRISCSTLRAAWLPRHIYEPPAPPTPQLNIGYVSSDFNNHPLAHLMQSVFGLHDSRRFRAICYATTVSDGSVHRQQIEQEAPLFYDASSWSIDRLVNQIVRDGVHVLVNLNGYTRGAKNEVFAARPAPIQLSFMGFAGTLGAEWCDYLLADKIAIPLQTLRPYRRNVDLIDQMADRNNDDDESQWVYGENIIFTRDSFFCCDHRQSAPDAREPQLGWEEEQRQRWAMRKEIFPDLPDDNIILGNFNQLYKIEPTTFRTWLRILSRIPKAVLWLLRFPDLGETNLRETAMSWVGVEVASRVLFTDVAPKNQHIARARVCDLFLDTPECNAHTTAADVLWSGTPLLTFPRYEYKMCSRMAASILSGALPKSAEGNRAREDLIVQSDDDYEERAVELGIDLVYPRHGESIGMGQGRLVELRRLLYRSRWTSALFDTRRWVRDVEEAYEVAWERWVGGEGGDIWL
ncbi:MAG: hypothetical protein Q9173_000030 [Seirophora scorigena]